MNVAVDVHKWDVCILMERCHSLVFIHTMKTFVYQAKFSSGSTHSFRKVTRIALKFEFINEVMNCFISY